MMDSGDIEFVGHEEVPKEDLEKANKFMAKNMTYKLKIYYDDEFVVMDYNGVSVTPDFGYVSGKYCADDEFIVKEVEQYILFSKTMVKSLKTDLVIELYSTHELLWERKIKEFEEKYDVKINWIKKFKTFVGEL